MNMRIAAIAAALVAFSPTAQAQPEAGYRGGLYAGAALGYASTVLTAENVDLGSAGAHLAGYAGVGAVMQGVYLGIEGDIALNDVRAGLSDGLVSVKGSADYTASLRARAGLPLGPILMYATAGPAFQQAKLSASDGTDSLKDSKSLIGLAAGGGIEAQLTHTMLLRLEGIHYAFPAESFRLGDEAIKLENRETVIRLGIGFALN